MRVHVRCFAWHGISLGVSPLCNLCMLCVYVTAVCCWLRTENPVDTITYSPRVTVSVRVWCVCVCVGGRGLLSASISKLEFVCIKYGHGLVLAYYVCTAAVAGATV